MYKLKDYILNGLYYANNVARPRHKKLTSLMIYATSRCQSRCRHCNIWQKPKQDLTLEDIKKIMSSKCVTRHTTVGLEGGEFVLHPQAAEIMAWFRDNHPNYTLLSNCLAPSKVVKMAREYKPVHIYLSLDGDKETYKEMRGVDGHDKVIEVVEQLKDEFPVSLMFCLSPWTTMKDMEYCIDVAKRHNIDIRIGIYGTMDFFDTSADMLSEKMEIPQAIHETSENYDFVLLYDYWRRGELKLPCHSIKSQLVIHPEGLVPICQNLGLGLGNVHEQSLDEIFNSKASIALQKQHCRGSNGCWINHHRKYDIIILRNLEKVLPKKVIEWFYGPYQWCNNPKSKYSSLIKTTCNDKRPD